MGDCGANAARATCSAASPSGRAQDAGRDRPRLPAGRPRRPVPGHDVRGAQADEVPAARSTRPTAPLPPPHGRIGFSQRRTVLYLYAWTSLSAGLAVALRFVPYSDNGGQLQRRLGDGHGASGCSCWRRACTSSTYSRSSSSSAYARSGCAAAAERHRARDRRGRRARLETGEFDAVQPGGRGFVAISCRRCCAARCPPSRRRAPSCRPAAPARAPGTAFARSSR